MYPLVEEIVSKLDANLREEFEERESIMEYDGRLPPEHAECLALLDVIQRHPYALTGVTALHIKLNESPQWWLTTNIESARNHLKYLGGFEVCMVDLADVVGKQFSGIAMLEPVR